MRSSLVEDGERCLYQLGLLRSAQWDQQAGDSQLTHLLVDRLDQVRRQAGIDDQGEVVGMQGGEHLPELCPIRVSAHINGVFVDNTRSGSLLCLKTKQRGLSAFNHGLHTVYYLSC